MYDDKLQPLVKRAAADLGIDQPIYHAQVIDQVLHLHLPHTVVKWPVPPLGRQNGTGRKPAPPRFSPAQTEVIDNPAMYDRETLRELVAKLGITPPGRDWKVDLVKAINQWKEENQWTP